MDLHPLPVHIDLRGRRCVVIGGGGEALHKTRLLLGSGARVELFSPDPPEPPLRALAGRGRIRHRSRWAALRDLRGAWMTFHTEPDRDPSIRRLARAAARANLLFSATDAPSLSTAVMPAIARRGMLQVSVGTGSASPATAVRIRDAIAEAAGPDFILYLRSLSRLRERVRREIPDSEKRKETMRRAARGLRVRATIRPPSATRAARRRR